ncbi:MAG: PRC-barrel domain-containing protein [Dietzia sp.]
MNLKEQLDALLDATAFDSTGAKIGAVRQVFVDDASGKITFATVSTGLFSADAIVPLHGARLLDDELHVDHTRAVIRDSPRPDNTEDALTPDQEARLLEYYGIEAPRRGGAPASGPASKPDAASKSDPASQPDAKPETGADSTIGAESESGITSKSGTTPKSASASGTAAEAKSDTSREATAQSKAGEPAKAGGAAGPATSGSKTEKEKPDTAKGSSAATGSGTDTSQPGRTARAQKPSTALDGRSEQDDAGRSK